MGYNFKDVDAASDLNNVDKTIYQDYIQSLLSDFTFFKSIASIIKNKMIGCHTIERKRTIYGNEVYYYNKSYLGYQTFEFDYLYKNLNFKFNITGMIYDSTSPNSSFLYQTTHPVIFSGNVNIYHINYDEILYKFEFTPKYMELLFKEYSSINAENEFEEWVKTHNF